MKPSMTLQQFISIFSATAVLAWALNLAWLAVLSVPLTFLWNHAVVPFGSLPCLTYGRTCGLLLFWFLLRLTQTGVKLSLK